MDTDDQYCNVWVNGYGDERYQPRLPDGRSQYEYVSRIVPEWRYPDNVTAYTPAALYKSKSKAIRIAKQKRESEIADKLFMEHKAMMEFKLKEEGTL